MALQVNIQAFPLFLLNCQLTVITSFHYSEEYPLQRGPVFTIHASWLSPEEISLLSEKLEQIYREQDEPRVIIFTWIEW